MKWLHLKNTIQHWQSHYILNMKWFVWNNLDLNWSQEMLIQIKSIKEYFIWKNPTWLFINENKKNEMRSGMCFSRFYKLSFFPLFLFLLLYEMRGTTSTHCSFNSIKRTKFNKTKTNKSLPNNIFHTSHCFKVYISYYLNISFISKNQFKFVDVNHSVWNLNSCSDLHFEWGVIFFSSL